MNLSPEQWLMAYCLGWVQGQRAEAEARFEAVRAVIVEGLSARAAAQRHALDARTVRKMVAGMRAAGAVAAASGVGGAGGACNSSAPAGQHDDAVVHGLRCAPPVATSLGPVGAEVAEVVR